jgi:hypothetical protein
MRGGDAGILTSFSINEEYTSDTFSERRGSILRASAKYLMRGCPSGTQEQIKAPFAGKIARSLLKAFPLRAWGFASLDLKG